ncbi:Uncharacterised protein [Yersinia frederiksenii]|nr:Uncharacterised protein [Yersinia frederiksenii]CNH85785.1 Uncharacterised protein [Yersinia frederiksenii]CNI20790.1 Uncharacterised protein [Yersinia frederiksenii]
MMCVLHERKMVFDMQNFSAHAKRTADIMMC